MANWAHLQVLTGGSTYRVPVGGRSTSPLTLTRYDVAYALAKGNDDALGVMLALSIATDSLLAMDVVRALAEPRLRHHLLDDRVIAPTLGNHARARCSVLTTHAFVSLVRARTCGLDLGARAARMRKQAYSKALDMAVGWMQGLADDAAMDAAEMLAE